MTATLHTLKPAPAPIDLLWPEYPRRLTDRGAWVRVGKALAGKELTKLLKQGESLDHIIAAARQYGKLQDPKFVRDCFRWLRDRLFEDYEPEQEAEVIPITSDEQQWQGIKATMQSKMRPTDHRTWIAPLDLMSTNPVVIAAPTEYAAKWVIREYHDWLARLWGGPVEITWRNG